MTEKASPLAGKQVTQAMLVNVPRLVTAYFTGKPDPAVPAQRVAFGTSGHRGSAFDNSFNENHILAISQAICLYRKGQGIDGPLFIGIDTHALSEPALASALEVFAANDVAVMVDAEGGFTPTPVVSHAILSHNRNRPRGLADGVVITPSHNPPSDGGFKYNPPNGGPADTDATGWIERTANEILADGSARIRRIPYERARKSPALHRHDYFGSYVGDLADVIDMEAIRASGVRIGIDPLGGAAARFWPAIIARYGIAATVVNDAIEPDFRFMTADWDGRIRMDCSSPHAMTSLVGMRERFDIAFANDPDADRHGIVCRSVGLMNPNHYLAASLSYLFQNRAGWRADSGVGKTVVSSSIIDRVAAQAGRTLSEVPVGFKWFVGGLLDGSLGFAGEESAGAAFLRRDGTVWTTDKDGIILGLLAAEITGRTGRDPGQLYDRLTGELGVSFYERIDAPANPAQKDLLKKLSPDRLGAASPAGEPIGGIKAISDGGWFAARPSGTEDVYKIYAESFRSAEHLRRIQQEAREIVTAAIGPAGGS